MYPTLAKLASSVPGSRLRGGADARVAGIAYDSRRVREGDLFVCIRGFVYDGHGFAADAVSRGASSLMVDRELPLDVPQLLVKDTRRAMGLVAAAFYGHPSTKLRVVGVTGTNGKTTTAYLIRAALRAAGRRLGLIGTIEQSVGDTSATASRTTPESADIQRLFFEMVQGGCEACVMEVSSHALVLHRMVGTEVDVGVFTNLTQDHFDFHKSFEEYLEAKKTLFRMLESKDRDGIKSLKRAVVNGDDPYAAEFVEATSVPVITYGLGAQNDVRAQSIEVSGEGLRYVAQIGGESIPVRLRLTGRFNVYNSLAALAVAQAEGIDLRVAASGIAETVVPGRFEPIDAGQDFTVIVDYAHTPDSLTNVLETARRLTQGRILCVFGAGGDRDKGKRPLMGEAAARLADVVVVTSDNPRSEDPASICEDVVKGIRRQGFDRYEVVVDRREGIRRAISLARPGDLVLIAGKGHETYQEFGGRTVHFDDREEAAKALRELETHGAG